MVCFSHNEFATSHQKPESHLQEVDQGRFVEETARHQEENQTEDRQSES